ncbi:hypothetical protein NPIL_318501 [Nephila pilipes]|uniref:Uncharacterized protein n=1 Tax=Nephila pilipes TaxID=299642 RepID=A0A8X6PUF3_NEPPI|nr:hypothetical protein NPIL_318501 [Nephila pilipes]
MDTRQILIAGKRHVGSTAVSPIILPTILQEENLQGFLSCSMWWLWSAWLSRPIHSWPCRDLKYSLQSVCDTGMVVREQRITQINSMMANLGGENLPLPILDVNEFSELDRLLRITEWVKRRFKMKPGTQVMAPLPLDRIQEHPSFDYRKTVYKQTCVKSRRSDAKSKASSEGTPLEDRINEDVISEIIGIRPLIIKEQNFWSMTCAIYGELHLELVTSTPLSMDNCLQTFEKIYRAQCKPSKNLRHQLGHNISI